MCIRDRANATQTDEIVNIERSNKINRLVSLLVVYLALIASVCLIFVYLGPSIASGLMDAAAKAPGVYASIEAGIMSLSDQGQSSMVIPQIFDAFNNTVNEISKNILSLANVAIGSAFTIISEIVVVLFALIVSAYLVYYKSF